jgi:transposase
MKSTTLWVGLDVHKESISVAVFEDAGHQRRPVTTIPNEPTQIRKSFSRLQREGRIRACYEAGSCGYQVYRQLAAMGIACDVVAPGLIPVRVGDRVKTDRRDADKLARLLRAGELTSIRVPTEAEEALRDLIRCREDAREEVQRRRHHVLKFLLRHGRVFRDSKHWTLGHWRWLRVQRFDEPLAQMVFDEYLVSLETTLARVTALDQEIARQAEKEPYHALAARLRCLRGIDTLSAMALIAEICDFKRFEHPRELMAYFVPVDDARRRGGAAPARTTGRGPGVGAAAKNHGRVVTAACRAKGAPRARSRFPDAVRSMRAWGIPTPEATFSRSGSPRRCS